MEQLGELADDGRAFGRLPLNLKPVMGGGWWAVEDGEKSGQGEKMLRGTLL